MEYLALRNALLPVLGVETLEERPMKNQGFKGSSVDESEVSATPKQIIAESTDLVFQIYINWKWYLKVLLNIGRSVGVQRPTKNSNTLQSKDGISF